MGHFTPEIDSITANKIRELRDNGDLSQLNEKDRSFIDNMIENFRRYGFLMKCSVGQRNYITSIHDRLCR